MNLVDFEAGRIRTVLPGLAPKVDCFAVDADKDWVAAGLTGGSFESGFVGIRIWKLDDPAHPWTFRTPETCRRIAIHPSLPRIAWAKIGEVSSLDVTTGTQTSLFDGKEHVRGLRFSADGRSLMVSGDHESIRDSETGSCCMRCPIRVRSRDPITSAESFWILTMQAAFGRSSVASRCAAMLRRWCATRRTRPSPRR
jgi:hypothetical protein